MTSPRRLPPRISASLARLCFVIPVAVSLFNAPAAVACAQPSPWMVAAAFDLAANRVLPPSYPQIPAGSKAAAVPASIIKAVGWVESGWRQFDASGRPLVSGDFGYGVMQITSGMAGAFHDLHGSIDPVSQSSIASDYVFNIAQGAAMLASKYAAVPRIGNGDPSVVEHWYYALWAYNGWGWVNNPNNPRFARHGTPASDPASYPYQERVLYLVAHPPRDGSGAPLWQPIPVTLPSRNAVGRKPGRLHDRLPIHTQPIQPLSAGDQSSPLHTMHPAQITMIRLRVENTGTQPWLAGSESVGYHVFTASGTPWTGISPFDPGIVAYGQGTTPLPINVLPSQSTTISVPLTAPTKPGRYRVVWDFAQGQMSWFSSLGAWTRSQMLTVTSPAASPPTPKRTRTSTPIPLTHLRYVADTSVPDGTSLPARTAFDKGWLVFNDGHLPWGPQWRFVHRSGPSFGRASFPAPALAPCRTANLIVHLRAPRKAGTFTSSWQLHDASGAAVGGPLTLVVRVTSFTPTPAPTPTATPHIGTTPTPTATPSG